MGSFSALYEELVRKFPDSKPRGDAFEEICQHYLRTHPAYQKELKTVWLWDEWPDRWGPDTGIDLVAETHDGDRWAVQAKAWNPERTLPKPEVDSFLAASARSEFDHRLLISTTRALTTHLAQEFAHAEKSAGYELWHDLDQASFPWPSTWPPETTVERPEPLTPRDYQQKAIDRVVEGLAAGGRGQLNLPPGSGKTLVGLWAAEALEAQRTLILLPSLTLVRQTLDVWATHSTTDFRFLAVCSDATTTDQKDGWVVSAAELGHPATTNPTDIANFLTGAGRRVIFSTYQSSPRIAEAFADTSLQPFDLVIADEAHRCAGSPGADFATVLDEAKLPATRRLFMTATPRILTGRAKGQAEDRDLEVASMDDATVFGPVLHAMSFREAIEWKPPILSDYQVVALGVDTATESTYEDLMDTYSEVQVTDTPKADSDTFLALLATCAAVPRYGLQRMISFHSSIRRATTFATLLEHAVEWLPDSPRSQPTATTARHINGAMSTRQREQFLAELRDPDLTRPLLISNARCLSEGVDVPALDGIIFANPKRSVVDICQALGRVLRRGDGKTIGTVVVPVRITQAADGTAEVDRESFSVLVTMLRAIRATDTVMADVLDNLRRVGPGSGEGGDIPGLVWDIPEGVAAEFVEGLQFELVELTTSSWEFWFGLLEQYVAEHGHVRVPRSHRTPTGNQLGLWVTNQRQNYRKNKMPPERIKRLEAVEDWDWDPYATAWEEGYTALVAYVAEHGHPRVPDGHRTPDGYKLGIWVRVHRRNYRQNKMPPERITRLEAVEGWVWDPNAADWEEGYRHLIAYVAEHGHPRVPDGHRTPDGYKLGNWVRVHRRNYRQNKMPPERIARLEAVEDWDWDWDPYAAAWEAGYAALLTYVAEQGTARVPSAYRTPDDYNLGSWISNQHQDYRQNKMPPERIARLEAVKGWAWGRYVAGWEAGYAALLTYVDEQRTARMLSTYRTPDGFRLGGWVETQRLVYRKNKMPPERIARLEAVEGWDWDPIADAWEAGYAALLTYVAEHGHARVPQGFRTADGYGLGSWVGNQRKNYRQNKMPPERVARLEALDGWVWDPLAAAWEAGYAALLTYVAEQGTARMLSTYRTPDGFRLGQWVDGQRQNHRKNKMPPERIARLEAVEGWVWKAR